MGNERDYRDKQLPPIARACCGVATFSFHVERPLELGIPFIVFLGRSIESAPSVRHYLNQNRRPARKFSTPCCVLALCMTGYRLAASSASASDSGKSAP